MSLEKLIEQEFEMMITELQEQLVISKQLSVVSGANNLL